MKEKLRVCDGECMREKERERYSLIYKTSAADVALAK